MSNEQLREAQRLADWLDGFHRASVHHECAAELRRLDAENQQLKASLALVQQHHATTEPAVNQQLTTELDEREAFEREMSCEEIWGHRSFKKKPDGRYANWCVDLMWAVWQARAAMAQVGDINAVESFTNDTKDALMAGRAYAQEALIRFDDAYDRHPSTEPDRNAILTDIQLIDAAMAKGV